VNPVPVRRRFEPNGKGRLNTYETCVAVVCLEEANRDHHYNAIHKKVDQFPKELPFDAGL